MPSQRPPVRRRSQSKTDKRTVDRPRIELGSPTCEAGALPFELSALGRGWAARHVSPGERNASGVLALSPARRERFELSFRVLEALLRPSLRRMCRTRARSPATGQLLDTRCELTDLLSLEKLVKAWRPQSELNRPHTVDSGAASPDAYEGNESASSLRVERRQHV